VLTSKKLGWHTVSFQQETGIVKLVSPTTGPLELSASEAYKLLQFLYTQQELLQLLAKKEEQGQS
jgi:hypothetical protein